MSEASLLLQLLSNKRERERVITNFIQLMSLLQVQLLF